MPLREIESCASKLGFEWLVREATLMDTEPAQKGGVDATGHIMCHMAKGTWVCENFAEITSFGMMFTSPACNIIIKNGVVDHVWFYMD